MRSLQKTTRPGRNATTFLAALLAMGGSGLSSPPAALAQTAPDPSVCDRTPAVRDAIIANSGRPDCASIDASDLSLITELILTAQNITGLQAGDFAGLTGMVTLDLESNQLTALPAGAFDGLTGLRSLWLSDNRFEALPAGIFDDLEQLEWLFISNNQLGSLPAGAFAELGQLTRLYLSSNQLSALPAGAFEALTQLEELGLRSNQFETLPDGIFAQLTRLTRLDLNDNLLESLPAGAFAALAQLRSLDLSVNPLPTLPPGIFDGLTQLADLTMKESLLHTLPGGAFDELSQLTLLDISYTQLRTLPAGSFDELVRLETLILGANQFATLAPALFDQLVNLKSLDLSWNLLNAVALSGGIFDKLTKLESLRLDYNEINTLPDGVFDKLTQLRELNLSVNLVLQRPLDEFDDFTSRTAPGPGIALRELPAGVFDELTQLTVLDLSVNQLDRLPAGIFDELSQLRTLRLFGNQLSELPPGLFDSLGQLQTLLLTGNNLASLPAGIFDRLTRLRGLDLGNNRLGALPNGIFDQLTQLEWLFLYRNPLRTLPAGAFRTLAQLEILQMDQAQLEALPNGIFAGLASLDVLWLHNNPGSPFALEVSLARAGAEGQVKALIASGAPFPLMLPLMASNGSIADAGGSAISSVAIATGATESEVFTVTRAAGASGPTTIDIGSLPAVPDETFMDLRKHQGYALRKSSSLPLRPFITEPSAPPSITRYASPTPLRAASTGGTTGAAFAGGATINGGVNYLATIPFDQNAGIVGLINPDPADVGRQADIFAAVRVGDTFYYYTQSGFRLWNIDLNSVNVGLEAYETITLPASHRLEIPDLEQALGRSLDDAEVIRVHFGYSRVDSTELVYSDEGVEFVWAPAPAGVCPSGTRASSAGGRNACTLSGTYAQDLHLTSNFDYVLSGAVFIGGDNASSAALTIDAGATVYGASGNDFLVISRGSKIHVNGSPRAPVIMTSANDGEATAATRGQWGGLIINGKAPINGCRALMPLCEAQGEGSTGSYGGNDPRDDSGNLNYLVVKYAGYEITPENELNGIAFQGVGSGTLVDYVQVHNSADDGVEFFGGRVNAKHLALTGNGDDSLDWVQGWQGKVQHVVIFQTDAGDQGFEGDNLDTGRDSLPRSQPAIANVTLIGNGNTDLGMLLREGTGANISNAVVAGFGEACLDIDDSATFANGGSSATALSGELTLTHSMVDCETNFAEQANDNWRVSAWFNNQTGNRTGGANMSSYVNSSAVNAMRSAPLEDAFFDRVDYVGAVKDADADWTLDWTFRGWENYRTR